ncbi:MAG: ABC transporter ATP-binding protein/permease [Candidatus Izimaplasma sp.]|nr:ABC transporter ATP-binding protein/permease [Candidatus Izimaplasma bacterium]
MIFGKSINKYYIQNIHLFIIGFISLIVVDTAQLMVPTILGEIIDGLDLGTLTKELLVDKLVYIAIITSLIVVGRFVWRMTIFGASRRFDYGLRNDMFEHAENLSNEFYSNRKVGGLMAYFTNDLESVRRAVGPGMVIFIDAVYLGGLALYKMSRINLRLTLYTGIPMIIIGLLAAYLGNKMRLKFKEAQKAFEDLSDFANESLSGIGVIKAFVKEQNEIKEFLKSNQRAKDKNIEFVKMQARLQITIRGVVGLIFVVILGFGAYMIHNPAVIENPFTVGELSEFYMLFGTLVWPMLALGMIINIRSRGKGSLQRIEEILYEDITVKDPENPVEIDELKGEIEFKNLSFKYPDGDENVLTDVSFKINPGETVGILGRTGSGKTSIVDLLLRIYNVEKGSILLDGIDIMDIKIKDLRDNFGYVPQDGFLFSDTITNNIALEFKDDEEIKNQVKHAAELSDVHDNIIEFSDGYETVIGERGATLSGGQKQRLSIARALLKNAPIMILDDSVSAVDTKTEETILNNLKQVREGKTTILIAHRISTIKNADKIIIVDDGTVVDVGTHEELLTRCDFYIDIVNRQKLQEEMGGE